MEPDGVDQAYAKGVTTGGDLLLPNFSGAGSQAPPQVLCCIEFQMRKEPAQARPARSPRQADDPRENPTCITSSSKAS